MGFGVDVLDHKFVGGGASGVMAGEHHQRTVLGDMAFAAPYRFVKRGRSQIPVHMFEIAEAMSFKTEGGHHLTRIWQ